MDANTKIDETLAKELEVAVDEATAEANPAKDDAEQEKEIVEETPEDNLPSDDESGDVGGDPDDGQGPDVDDKKLDAEVEPPVIPDELVDKAIKAGMSYADLKSFNSADALTKVISIIDAKKAGDDESAGKPEEKNDSEVESILKQMPELDPEEYDEKIVNGFKTMQEVVEKLLAANKELSGKLDSSAERDFVSTKVAEFGEKAVAKTDDIRKKFKVLDAGYKAAGEKMSKEDVLKEAASLVVGTVELAESGKRDALKKRESQMVNRTTNVSRKAKVDPEEETAALLDKLYFDKK